MFRESQSNVHWLELVICSTSDAWKDDVISTVFAAVLATVLDFHVFLPSGADDRLPNATYNPPVSSALTQPSSEAGVISAA